MTTEMIIRNLGGLVSSKMSYSEEANAFITNGYVSQAQNVYLNAFRFAEGIIIKEDIGQGHTHTFLNGIKVYSIKNNALLMDRSYHKLFYSKFKVKQEVKEMLFNLVNDAAKNEGLFIDRRQAYSTIDKVLYKCFNENQQQLAHKQRQNRLSRYN